MKLIAYIFCLLVFGKAVANEDYSWLIMLNDERIIKAKSINLEFKGSIKFIDDYDLERIVKVEEIALIKKIRQSSNIIDCILLKDKSKIIGDISEYIPAKYLRIMTTEKGLLTIEIVQIENISSIERPLAKGEQLKYIEFGATLGYPSAVNLNISYWLSNFGIGLSGLYIFLADGIQLNASYCLDNNKIYRHGFTIFSGISNIRKDKFGSKQLQNFHWEYAGLAYEFNYNGFYSELGISLGAGNYSNPNFIFQFGYVHRFLD